MAELPRRSIRDEPESTVERAAAAALEAAEQSLVAAGATAERVFVVVRADSVPAGELDCTIAGHGYEDAGDLMAELLVHLREVAAVNGFTLHVMPIGGAVHDG